MSNFLGSTVMEVVRNNLTISQKDLANFLCVSQPVISRIETRKQIPTEAQCKLIAIHLNMPDQWSIVMDEFNPSTHAELSKVMHA